MNLADPFLTELEQESATTRRVLERLPADRLGFRPHAKSYSLGQLALHVARLPAELTQMLSTDRLELSGVAFGIPEGVTKDEILATFESSLGTAREFLSGMSNERATQTWRLVHGEMELMAIPRLGVVRGFMLNHLYHHRGQVLVYLRMLDVPLPSVYGPTADENPFAAILGA